MDETRKTNGNTVIDKIGGTFRGKFVVAPASTSQLHRTKNTTTAAPGSRPLQTLPTLYRGGKLFQEIVSNALVGWFSQQPVHRLLVAGRICVLGSQAAGVIAARVHRLLPVVCL